MASEQDYANIPDKYETDHPKNRNSITKLCNGPRTIPKPFRRQRPAFAVGETAERRRTWRGVVRKASRALRMFAREGTKATATDRTAIFWGLKKGAGNALPENANGKSSAPPSVCLAPNSPKTEWLDLAMVWLLARMVRPRPRRNGG